MPMAFTVTVRDETPGAKETTEFTLELMSARITVDELIRQRVYQEVTDYNREQRAPVRWLVEPGEREAALNPARRSKPREVSFERQHEVAREAFGKNGFFILVDGRQVETLGEEIELGVDTDVRFLRLVPLVGG
jgi:hypothetical protein